ncbi:DUF262 domain-containing protein [Bradyrhizobium sp. Ai1a-2]|uniref:DUF262 domain-containing protein n=1 Tax=Bradyrhizobium sp. Ai1a-2 TaxID=196490 RepID=UPI0006849A6C|nr:DUF262 domain-containing protein [Bradyrhizobium sp. Ai1a-2]
MAGDTLTIRGLVERVLSGTIRIPKFQRGFVWEPEKVAFLMDSIYRGYPIGSVLFWRSSEKLTGERNLGPFQLPEPSKKWPIDYVLDGQQRITSLFGVFQTLLQPIEESDAFQVYFDLSADEGALEDQFVAVSGQGGEGIPNLFPLRLLFDPAAFAIATRDRDANTLNRLVELQRRFQEAQLKNEIIEFDDREQIAMIFERVNRAGIPLDTFQLLTAWTWSDEFDLNERVQQLGSEVSPYGFSKIGDQQDLLMKCTAAVIEGDASTKSIVSLHGPTVRSKFEVIQRGLLGAIEFLRHELKVHSLEIMPYPAMLVPLCRFFATEAVSGFHPSAKQRRALVRWFWRNCLARRYSGGVNQNHAADIAWMDELKSDENATVNFEARLDPFHFLNTFNIGTVNTKIFILLLASRYPRSLVSNAKVNLSDVLLRCNRNEFHHIFPKAHLLSQGEQGANWIANFCFLSAADNQKIKDKSPSEYHKLIKPEHRDDVFKRAMLPEKWHQMTYRDFIGARLALLTMELSKLSGLPVDKESDEYFKRLLARTGLAVGS